MIEENLSESAVAKAADCGGPAKAGVLEIKDLAGASGRKVFAGHADTPRNRPHDSRAWSAQSSPSQMQQRPPASFRSARNSICSAVGRPPSAFLSLIHISEPTRLG